MRWQIEAHQLTYGMDYNLPNLGVPPSNPIDLVNLVPMPHLKSQWGWVKVGDLHKPTVDLGNPQEQPAYLLNVIGNVICYIPRAYDNNEKSHIGKEAIAFMVVPLPSRFGDGITYDPNTGQYIGAYHSKFNLYNYFISDTEVTQRLVANSAEGYFEASWVYVMGYRVYSFPPMCPTPSARVIYPTIQFVSSATVLDSTSGTPMEWYDFSGIFGGWVDGKGYHLAHEASYTGQPPFYFPYRSSRTFVATLRYVYSRMRMLEVKQGENFNWLWFSKLGSASWDSADVGFMLPYTQGMVIGFYQSRSQLYVLVSDGIYVLDSAEEPYVFIPQLLASGITPISIKTVASYEDTVFVLCQEGIYIIAGRSAQPFSQALNPIIQHMEINRHPVPPNELDTNPQYPPAHWCAMNPRFLFVHLDLPYEEKDRLYVFHMASQQPQLTSFELPSDGLLYGGVTVPTLEHDLVVIDNHGLYRVANMKQVNPDEVPPPTLYRLKYGQAHRIRYQSRWWHFGTTAYKRLMRVAFHGNVKCDRPLRLVIDYAVEHPDAGYVTKEFKVPPDKMEVDVDITARWFRFTLEGENVSNSELFALVLHYKPRTIR
jgi:hypothetical protein